MTSKYGRCALAVAAAGLSATFGIACSVRTAATSDLWNEVPEVDAGGQTDTKDRSTPDGGFGIPATCTIDPKTVPDSKTVDVPAGQFAMGCYAQVDNECRADEKPQHSVTLGDFTIDQTEVTQAQYAKCMLDGKCGKPFCIWDPCKDPDLPIACVDYAEASAYCAYVGKRLPTEAEWEKAARSTDGRKYPWGNEPPDCTRANMVGCAKNRMPVGQLTAGASPYGALDMAGNVVEWVADFYSETYYAQSPAENPPGPPVPAQGTKRFGGRGGGWRSVAFWQRVSTRDFYEVDYVRDSLGIRCAK